METQTTTTPTVQTTATETPKTEEVGVAVPATEETPASPDVVVAVDGVEVAVTDTKEEAELSPAVGAVVVLVLGLIAVAVARLRKK